MQIEPPQTAFLCRKGDCGGSFFVVVVYYVTKKERNVNFIS